MYFDKILIANRGEIAVRIIRSCHELGIAAVAVYSEADRSALHVRQADQAVAIGPAAASASYLSVERIIEAALSSGAQAIHPGYGFLSERTHFARACREAGLVFIGPPPEAIDLMGSKIAAKRLAESVGVPTAPGYMGDDQRPERLRAEAERVGFPLLIKASAGGGGKGMRTVRAMDEFDAALEGAKREARAAFGDDSVFLERLILRPRHVEIQVLADAHGNCVSLFERECSIQRRHQKIVEESPSPALTPELRAEMGAAAVRLALAAGYVNAGTVEFVLGPDGRPAFLEMNTRLQVEHPVTESVTGLDLVRLQIAIAAGERLPFGQADLAQRGHAIEVRVYAEDPATFLPSTGRVALFAPPEGPGVRNDAGLQSGDEVTVNYDPMLAKLIVSAPERRAAIERLVRALDEYAVLGVTTNLPLLRAVARHPAFAEGATTTDFLTEHGLTESGYEPALLPPEVLAAAALAGSDTAAPAARDPWQAGSWRLLRDGVRRRYLFNGEEQSITLSQRGAGWQAQAGDTALDLAVVAARPDALTLEIRLPSGGSAQLETFRLAREGSALLIGWRGASYRLVQASSLDIDTLGGRGAASGGHASLSAPMPGTVVKVLVEEGQQVAARQPLIVLEAMKMEHVVAAPHDGLVRKLFFRPGDLVAKGAALVDLDQS
ncbi:MAG: acetyl-CoA carboxylase biotin carboxylase subunit [Roseiflexaceae bacterium]